MDRYEHYVKIQSDAALRHLANCYPYDHGEEEEVTLRSGIEEVSSVLKKELQESEREAQKLRDKLQKSYGSKEIQGLKLPRKPDQLDLFRLLIGKRAKGVKDTDIADEYSPSNGRKVLGQLKTARKRGTISNWRQKR